MQDPITEFYEEFESVSLFIKRWRIIKRLLLLSIVVSTITVGLLVFDIPSFRIVPMTNDFRTAVILVLTFTILLSFIYCSLLDPPLETV